MGSPKVKPVTILAGASTSSGNIINPSRLTESTEELRDALMSRNLYNDFREYPLQPTTRQRIVNTVDAVIDAVAPFKGFDLNNSPFGRLITLPNTPLTDIGLVMLGKQFQHNFQSNLAQEVFPTIKLSNIWDGNPSTNLFTLQKNYRITQREGGNTVEGFLERFVGFTPASFYPYTKDAPNEEILRKTGSAQQVFLFEQINKNLYKTNDSTYLSIAEEIKNPIRPMGAILEGEFTFGKSKKYFNFIDNKFNPYLDLPLTNPNTEINANFRIRKSNIDIALIEGQEYAPDNNYIENYLGKARKNDDYDDSPNLETGFDEVLENQIIWGRDGISDSANERISKLRGIESDLGENFNLGDKFNVKTGLLKYTSELLNASNGQFVDQTRKRFTEFGPIKNGFNGSGLWKAPKENEYLNSNKKGKEGLRQHTILDQYDRFAKAIRFDGNIKYDGGNNDSVIYKSVIPRIHPTIGDNNKIDNRNLMFSIENLAIRVIDTPEFGLIDDEIGTQIPKSEVGPFKGRMMWFPPYGIEINEVAIAKWDSNVFVGRSEPVYTYMHSERTATINFKLIIDYPPQAKNGKNHKELAEFFAFGGDSYDLPENTNNNIPKEQENNEKIKENEGPTEQKRPEVDLPDSIRLVFPNDIPYVNDNLGSVIDQLYTKYTYEIKPDYYSVDGTSWGLNEKLYYVPEGTLTKNDEGFAVVNVPAGFSQYTYKGQKSILDESLFNLFNDPDNRKYYKINILARASKLFTPGITNDEDTLAATEYNKEISERRADVAKIFIQARIKALFGQSAINDIKINVEPIGDSGASDAGASIDAISEQIIKSERSAEIFFDETDISTDKKEPELLTEDQKKIETLKKENEIFQKNINKLKRYGSNNDYTMKERTSSDLSDEDGGILKGYKSIIDNYFYPAFHTQTPEDFHRRLTFLQQCTRQGSAIRGGTEKDSSGVGRVKNSVFGRQPICVLRIGDFFNTKIIIDSINMDYVDAPWDLNPEGFGMQPMLANVTMQIKIIGGQSLKGPIDALQNAVSYNYYANSTFSNKGIYSKPSSVADEQRSYIDGVLTAEQQKLEKQYNNKHSSIDASKENNIEHEEN
jgi:hypothetical protein